MNLIKRKNQHSAVNKETYEINHLSASQIDTFLRCPLIWYFRYVRGEKIMPNIALVFGSAVHKGLEYIYSQKKEGKKYYKDTASDMVEQTFNEQAEEVETDASEKMAQKISAVSMIESYIDSGFPEEIEDEEIEEVEANRSIMLIDGSETVEVQVKQDLILKDRIRDFKTTRGIPKEHPVKYKIQLALYAVEGRKKKAEIEYLAKTKSLRREVIPIDEQSLVHNKKIVAKIFLSVWRQMRKIAENPDLDYLMKEGLLQPVGLSSDWACKYCGYGEQGLCPYAIK